MGTDNCDIRVLEIPMRIASIESTYWEMEEAVETGSVDKRQVPPDWDPSMAAVNRLGKMRAPRPPDLADEMAFLRMRLIRAHDQDSGDVQTLSLGLERLARIKGADRKLSGKGSPDLVEKMMVYMQAFRDRFNDVPRFRDGEPMFAEPDEGWDNVGR
jgi:hypothetical protein